MKWRLIFSGTQSLTWSISVCLAIVLAVTLFLFLRKYEARLVSPRVSRSLLTLRILVLLVLLATLLQPVLTRAWDEDRRSRLVVGIDVSESMETADRHATPAEMLRWAQALGMLGNDRTSSLIDTWIAAYDSGQQPDWGAEDPDLADSRRRHIEGVFSQLSGMSRTEFVRRLLLARPNDLLAELGRQLDVDLQVFGVHQQSIRSDQLQELLNSDRQELRPGGTDAVGLLAGSIGEEGGNRIQGIVLFSDGRQTVPADAAAEAGRLASLGIPVYAVPIGSILSPRDLSIATVQVPQSVFLDDNAQVQVTVTSSGFVGDRITVNLQRNGNVVDQQTVPVAADSFEVGFEIPTDETGNHEYSVSTEVQPGELREDNNSRDFTVSVVDNKARVLLVEGDARWEFRYLKSALERDSRVELSTILFRQPFLQLLNRTFLDRELPELAALQEQLANTDILIIGDVAAEKLPEPFWQTVEQAVADEGLTLLVVPGHRHMPHQYSSPALDRLLPVRDPRPQMAERYQRSLPDADPTVFRLEPTVMARDLTLFDFSGAGEDSDSGSQMTLSGLPGHPWACTGKAKPIATVWANIVIPGLDLNSEETAAVVHQYYGFGQVVWFGVDSTWRWRRRAGDRWHHRFWGQVVRWAAQNKSAAGNDQVRMTMSDVIIDESEAVDVAVRWNPKLATQLQDALLEIVVEPIDGPADDSAGSGKSSLEPRRLRLEAVEGFPERFTTRLTGLNAASYRVSLQVSNSNLKLDDPIESDLIVQKRLSTELANISCNREFLQQLATASGGRLMEPWQLPELPELLRPQDLNRSIVQEKTLWDHWALLVVFFSLLTAEWILRKVNGLP
ncbi:MAG: hypothetical protein RIK87_16330 [Fuerstiella sp.]